MKIHKHTMGCDYYKSASLVIITNQPDNSGALETKYVPLYTERGYYPSYRGDGDDSDVSFDGKTYLDDLNGRTPDKDLFVNGTWLKEDYKKKYSYLIGPTYDLVRVYKTYTFWERR